MSEWQKCPVCDGTGLVSKPPYIAGDVNQWVSSSTGPYPCKTCTGSGVLQRPCAAMGEWGHMDIGPIVRETTDD